MTIARGELQRVSYVQETTFLNPPSTPTMLELWHNSESLAPQRAPFRSGRSLGDRQVADVRMGRKSGAGNINSELCYANFDPLLRAVLCSDADFPTAFAQVSATTISATSVGTDGGGTIDDSGSGFTNVAAGDFIYMTGWTSTGTANNATWYVTAATATSLTVVPEYTGQTALASKIAGDTVLVNQKERITNGTTEVSFAVELLYADITRYHQYTGGVVNTMGLTVPANGIVTVDWGWLFGNYTEVGTSWGTPTIPTAYSPFDGLSGTYLEGGIANALMTAISLNVNNNYQLTEALGSDNAEHAIPRKFSFEGSVSYYKEDDVISAKFFNETESSIVFTLTDPSSNSYTVTIPRVKYTSLAEGKGDDGPIISRLNFEAIRHAQTLSSIYIEKS